jgi:hypothetical protein
MFPRPITDVLYSVVFRVKFSVSFDTHVYVYSDSENPVIVTVLV